MIVRDLTSAERRDWLRLYRSENVGPIAFRQLLRRYGTADAALAALPELAKRGGKRGFKPFSQAEATAELERLAALDARLICLCEPDYPELLRHVEDAPPVLAVRGHAHLWRKPAVAIVGARNASFNGLRFAEDLARALGEAGLVVVSGLARGIDTAAHKGALATGTVAAMAGGVDVCYPAENRGLYDAILAAGALISELAPGVQPQARHFPRRNRIVAGIAAGTVVVEAALRSGSLITARLAAEQGREVFAVPGSPLDPRAKGTNDLLRQGATLVEGAKDILDALLRRPLAEPSKEPEERLVKHSETTENDVDAAREILLRQLGPAPTSVDEILRGCQLSAPAVLAALLELELAGRLERYPGNKVALRV
ncbi:MAG: DNA-protecting protein DprA [Azospirillum sp.]|nr:DNA-protecting protein DprA [Azospirillum sp.]